MSEALELEDYWDDIRPPKRPRHLTMDWHPPLSSRIQGWQGQLSLDGPRVLAVEGPTSTHREEVYRTCGAGKRDGDGWLVRSVQAHFVDQFWTLLGDWGLLWGVTDVKELILDDPLHGLVDQGFRFTEVFQALWEIRFLRDEGRDVRSLMMALVDWFSMRPLNAGQQDLLARSKITRELSTPQEQLDVLFFLSALAHQNDVLQNAVVVFDGLDRALGQAPKPCKKLLRDLLGLVTTAERWGRLGSPLGLAIGYHADGGTLGSLERANRKLWHKIVAGRCTS